ncbi:Fc.00g064590.m01.CDS01 [Cosmosporella sp. VM-42]
MESELAPVTVTPAPIRSSSPFRPSTPSKSDTTSVPSAARSDTQSTAPSTAVWSEAPLSSRGPASPSSSSYHNHPSPTSPRNAVTVHARSQTIDVVPSTNTGSSTGPPSGNPLKRKPLSSVASALATRFSSSSSPALPSPIDLPKPNQRFTRPFSVDSPTLYEFSPDVRSRSVTQSQNATVASNDAAPPETRNIPVRAHSPTETEFSDVLSDYGYDDLISLKSDSAQDATPGTVLDDRNSDKDSAEKENSDKDPSEKDYSDNDESESAYEESEKPEQNQTNETRSNNSDNINSNPSPPMFAPKPTPPHLKLDKVDTSVPPDEPQSETRSGTPQSTHQGISPRINKPLPKSPGKSPSQTSPFAALFNWAVPSPSATDFSSFPSPVSPSRNGANDTPYSTTSNSFSEGSKSNGASANPLGYLESYLSTPSSIEPTAAQIEEMEDELKQISAELASSIRREMDLEDLVDRLQEQVNNPQAPGKRTSDYFSDSGYSSAKLSEYDQSRDEVDKIQRRSEQEKASIRLELTTKLQDERTRRKALDQQIKDLAERASQIDLVQMNNLDSSDRVKDLESTCEDLRRRLSEERTAKNNFEDLLTALRGELHGVCNERDNLRDEVVPQLRARVEGLETEAAEYANLTYESSKMQQELQSLMKENNALRNTPRSGASTPPLNRMSRAMSGGLARSNSVATGSFRGQRPPALSGLSRSNSVKNPQNESREALSERLKDVEAQRDALHSALKSLLERQEVQNRENEKKIRLLQTERERLLSHSHSPRKAGFEKDISNLRLEINVLRRRAEDALEQKWEVEKGLGGLKMDLDRAEEEIALLRDLLKEKDILIPESFARSSGSSTASSYGNFGTPVTSESLERAYKELQTAYTESLERIKKLELDSASDEKTQLAMERLERSLSAAVTERDAAKHEVDALRSQFDDLSAREGKNLDTERALADELSESASRVEELATQVRHQLSTNAELRQRLADTVARGERDRKTNVDRIAELQDHLRVMEEQLVAAQTASEDRIARHEEEITALREAHNDHLQRMSSTPGLGGMRSPGFKSTRKGPLLSPMSPIFPKSSRISPAKTFEDAAQMKALRERVSELEKALEDAEHEMQDVVARMSIAQIEVLNLQEERETAVRETRRLQKTLEQEHMKSFEQRFKSLSGTVS